MAVKTPHEQRLEWWTTTIRCFLHAMDKHNKQLASDLIISGFIVALTITEGANPTAAVGALTVINTVTVGQIIQAFREIQAQNRNQYTDE